MWQPISLQAASTLELNCQESCSCPLLWACHFGSQVSPRWAHGHVIFFADPHVMLQGHALTMRPLPSRTPYPNLSKQHSAPTVFCCLLNGGISNRSQVCFCVRAVEFRARLGSVRSVFFPAGNAACVQCMRPCRGHAEHPIKRTKFACFIELVKTCTAAPPHTLPAQPNGPNMLAESSEFLI